MKDKVYFNAKGLLTLVGIKSNRNTDYIFKWNILISWDIFDSTIKNLGVKYMHLDKLKSNLGLK